VTKSSHRDSKSVGHIYIGVGGWTFAPWRGVFYPEKLTQAKELEYAASKLTSIEINGTYFIFLPLPGTTWRTCNVPEPLYLQAFL
jgi:uncharacterized protein YecE (DUF72 family)